MDVKELLDRLICMLFPPRCLSCGKVALYEDAVCAKCGYEHVEATVCMERFENAVVSGAVSAALYSGGIKKAVWLLKDRPDPRIRRFFADLMRGRIEQNWPDVKFDCVAPVPLSPEKQKTRGFNQAGFLAKELAELLQTAYADDLLAQRNVPRAQRTLSAGQRRENAQNSFYSLSPKAAEGKIILLADDVLTTGATLRTCASLLLENGAEAVYAVTAACAPAHKAPAYAPGTGAPVAVGFTGNRLYAGANQDESSSASTAIKTALSAQLDALLKAHAVSRVIVGPDMASAIWMAEAVLEKTRKYPSLTLECAVAFEDQPLFWNRKTRKQFMVRYERILNHRRTVRDGYTPPAAYTEGCYRDRDLYIVHECDVLIALWNGRPGDTSAAIRTARRQDKTCIVINPVDFG